MRVRFLISLLLGPALAAPGPAQDWPRFRGPNGGGVSAAVLPTRWTDQDYRWQVKTPGPGHSSPVTWQGRLFITGADAAGKLHVACLDAATGRTAWTRAFVAGPPRGHQDNSLASSTPAVDAHHVYVAWGTPKETALVALTHDGTEAWRRDLGPYRAGHGFGGSPIVHDGLVVLPCEDQDRDCIVAVDALTGAERWRVRRKSRGSYATPCVFQAPGRPAELIAVSYEDGVTSLELATGRRTWAADVFDKRHVEAAIASPFVHGGLILASAGWLGERYETIALRPGAGGTADTAYKLDRDAPLVPTPVATDDLLFLWGDRGIVSCCGAATGKRRWRERVEGSFYASPVIAGRHLYCPSREGDMVVLAADRTFKEVGRVGLGEGTQSTPAIAGGRLFIRTPARLMCLEGSGEPGTGNGK